MSSTPNLSPSYCRHPATAVAAGILACCGISLLQRSGHSLRTDTHLVSSYFVAKLCIHRIIKIVSFLPTIQTHTSAASPASMSSSTVGCCILLVEQSSSALSLNNALEVNPFPRSYSLAVEQSSSALCLNNALEVNPFPRSYSLDVVSHPNIACMNRMLLQMSAPNSLWVTLISQMRPRGQCSS